MKRVLFLCTSNSCRSQMAEGWMHFLYGDLYEVCSAGIDPQGLDPRAVKIMAEEGVDISGQTSDHIDKFLHIPFELVITVCDSARETCPFFPGDGKRVHRSFEDPPFLAKDAGNEEKALSHYRRVRDEIRDFVTGLPEML